MTTPLKVGQVWRENDDRYRIPGASPHRHVEVLACDTAQQRVQIAGIAPYAARKTWTATHRFNGPGKTGFTFVRDTVAIPQLHAGAMTRERAAQLQAGEGALTREEWDAGWRFCCDFDGLLLNCTDPENPEARICNCQQIAYPEASAGEWPREGARGGAHG